jgi:hypothetical protein
MWYIVVVLIIIALVFFTLKGRQVTVYGSMGCPWTVKQVDYLKSKNIGYTFVDCTGDCPPFVQGFPTTKIDDKIMVGYTEEIS